MHVQRVGFPGRAWLGLVAGLGIGLVLSVLGVCLGFSFRAPAQEGPPAGGMPGGPLVVVTLQQGGTVKGALLESRDGKVRLQVAGESAERVYAVTEITGLDFASEEPVVAQANPTPGSGALVPEPPTKPLPADPKSEAGKVPEPDPDARPDPVDWPKPRQPDGPAVQPKDDDAKRPIFDPLRRRRSFVEDRRKRVWDFLKQRADERLTPDERRRLHELVPREQNLDPAERQELDRIRAKMGMMEPELFRRLTNEVMDEAIQAQKKGNLNGYMDGHLKRLGYAMTEDERRRHVASLFAATHVGNRDVPATLRDIALQWMRSTKAPPEVLDERIKELHVMYDLFMEQVEKGNPPEPRPRGL